MAPRNERGSALLVTLLTTVLMAGLAGGLAITVMTEEAIEANHRRGVSEVAGRPRWQSLLDGTVPSALRVGPAVRTLADGSLVDLGRVTNGLQRELDRARGDGAPRWRLYAWAGVAIW